MILRYARHTNDLNAIKTFYSTIIQLDVLGEFNDHDGYDGIFLGKENENWHLEFTTNHNKVNHHFNEDDYLVFYPNTLKDHQLILDAISKHKIPEIKPHNPYWVKNGIAIKDPDGLVVIISKQKI